MRYFWCELAIVSAFMITFAVEFNSLTIINIRTMVNYKDLGLVKLEISNTSHPFYTGKSKLVDTAGRVDKFMSRYGNRMKK